MAVPSYTVYGNHPRIWFRDTDKTTLQTRVGNASGWKTLWDGTIKDKADTLKGQTDAQIINHPRPDQRIMVLALYGYLEETGVPAGGYKEAAISATLHLALNGPTSTTKKRHRLAGCAAGFDILYDDMTAGQRDNIAGEIIKLCDGMSRRVPQELFTGHSGLEQALQVMGALAIHGHHSGSQQRLTEGLEFWMGNGTDPATTNGTEPGRLGVHQYYMTDGCSHEHGHYLFRNVCWELLWFLTAVTNGTSLDLWTSESSWLSELWRQMVWTWRGDDIETLNDSTKVSDPFAIHTYLYGTGILSEQYPTPDSTEGGKHCRWIWDRLNTLDGSMTAEDLIYSVAHFDKATNTAVAPEDAISAVDNYWLASPPGIFYYREATRGSGDDDWDYANSTVFRVMAREYFYQEHSHLDVGSMAIYFNQEPILLSPTGVYPGLIGDLHNLNWNQRTVGQSMAPLIFRGDTYTHYSEPVADDGGQQYKKHTTTYGSESRPQTVQWMTGDGGGEAWKLTDQAEILQNDADVLFFKVDFAKAYLRRYTAAATVPTCETKFLIIKPTAANGLTDPACLVYVRVIKTDSDDRVVIPFHFANAINTETFGFRSKGYGDVGQLWVDVRDIANYTLTNNVQGTVGGDGYGDTQFQIAGGGTNYKPDESHNSREAEDVKTDTMWVEKTTRTAEEHYVFFLMPAAGAAAEPVSGRAWLTEGAYPDWYGVDLSSELYMVSRTQDVAAGGGGGPPAPDTTPPADVTSLAGTVRDSAIDITYTESVSSDHDHNEVYYRTTTT